MSDPTPTAVEAALAEDPLALDRFDYAYPPELIAHEPARPRDASRLLHLPARGAPAHLRFGEIAGLLRPGDLLVINETRVVKARLRVRRVPSDGAVELLALGPAPEDPGLLRVLAKPARRMRPGGRLRVGAEVELEIVDAGAVRLPPGLGVAELLEAYGEMPLPPYIAPTPGLDVARAYQPVFARVDGSVAAPTASLHFTDDLLARLRAAGVEIRPLVLEVGLGTFAPVRTVSLRDHVMHEERFEIPPETAAAINATRARGGRVVAVGTTVVRALESSLDAEGRVLARRGATGIFIGPGHRFGAVDALVTNFHVPRSTLLALVSAFAGRERILAAYAEAIALRYRLFSFGDAMLLERAEAR